MQIITPMELYWITRLDNINVACAILLTVFAISMIMSGSILFGDVNIDYEQHKLNKKARRYTLLTFRLSVFAVFLLISAVVLIPSTKEMAIIKVLPAIVNNPSVQKECSDLYRLAKNGLQELVTSDKTNEKTK